MKDDSHQPGRAPDVSTRNDGGRWTLVFVRQLAHPPERVWQALTDPAELAAWAPFDADRDLARTGPAVLTMAGGAPEPLPAEVRHAEAPRCLEYTWGEDLLRWELEPSAGGTRLTLLHTLTDPGWLPKVAAGWHICLDVADRRMGGRLVPRIVGEQALQHGWQRLHDEYAAQIAGSTRAE